MSKSVRAAKKYSIESAARKIALLALSVLMAAGPILPAFAQADSKSATDAASNSSTGSGSAIGGSASAGSAGVGNTPESDGRSASDTVWSVNSEVEKKLEQDALKPKTGTERANSAASVLEALTKSVEEQKKKEAAGQAGAAGTSSSSVDGAGGGSAGGGSAGSTGDAGSSASQKTGAVTPSNPLMPSSDVSPKGSQIKIESPAAPQTSNVPAPKAGPPETSGGSAKLFGRIEQISADGDVKLPPLQMQTAKLDTRGKMLPGEIEKYSGTIAKQFPNDFRGTWGGLMTVWSYRYSPLYLEVDRAEAVNSANILKVGRGGNVNFQFYRNTRTNQIALEPATVLLSIPMKDSFSYKKMMQGSGGMNSQMGPFAGNFNQLIGNMEAPIIALHFGNAATSSMETGVSGNEFKQTVVKNVIRELGPGVIEQQIVSKYSTVVAGSGKRNQGYEESVMRFKRLSETQLYVLVASVKYTGTGKYLSKLIMYGTVDRGKVVQTNPMGDMNKMMGQMMNLGNMQSMFGGSNGKVNVPQGGYKMPTMPTMPGGSGGFNPADIMKQMQQLQQFQR